MQNIYEETLSKDRVIVLADSINVATGHRFITYMVRFPKILLQELNTHRQLVRNCGSSRAIPSSKYIDNIYIDTYIPDFTKNKRGMVGDDLDERAKVDAECVWLSSMDSAVKCVEDMIEIGVHKQDANRILEPFAYVDLVISGTEWANFFVLRMAEDAQPAFRDIAIKMHQARLKSTPNHLMPGEWHIPFDGFWDESMPLEWKLKIAIARCARVSYASHGNEAISVEKDLELYGHLVENGHKSPLEHIAQAVPPCRNNPDLPNNVEFSRLLNPNLYPFLFYNTRSGFYTYTRQYASFYSFRSQVEDGEIEVSLTPD